MGEYAIPHMWKSGMEVKTFLGKVKEILGLKGEEVTRERGRRIDEHNMEAYRYFRSVSVSCGSV